MTRPLTGRAVLVTGASTGLGAAIARRYAQRGASVVMCARDAGRLEIERAVVAAEAESNQVVAAVAADVSAPADVDRLVDVALQQVPQVHVLVNNAGIYGPMGASELVDWDAWVHAIEVNLFGSVLMIRRLLPHFKAHRYGKIVQLSGGGATNPLPRISAYAASKAAVVRFAESVALEVAEFGIDVNAIAPGALNTGMTAELLRAGPAAVGESFYERMRQIADQGGTPLAAGADLAVFLGSPESDGITGRLISAVWDDWHDLPNRRAELAGSDIFTLRRIVPADRGKDWPKT
jgi:NAD(P)-dependent dehydrogenase (short-subunit alcohol dehydrogenase family)